MPTCPSCGRENRDSATYCEACATPLRAKGTAAEERKVVTIVFCDLVGSTALGERLDPESLRDVQSRYFDEMRGAIERHGGTVEKYIGDAVMAVFGIPRLHEDDALRAIRAAADMREGLTVLNKGLERDRGVTIQVRIGVNSGEVVAGDPSIGRALVTGDAVNVAARLEQHASSGEVLLGGPTYRLVRDTIEAEPVEPLELKGKAVRIPAWRLVGVREGTSAVSRRLNSHMVGRERQLAQLRRAFEAAATNEMCQLFTVLGAAGVGKSRLVEEFLSGLGDGPKVFRGRCLPYGEGITYFPVVEAVRQAAGLADFDLPDVVEAKVCSVLEGDEHRNLICRHVSQMMGVADSVGGEETPWAIRRFFEASARDHPLALVFDDIQWGQPTFLDLVEYMADSSRGSPILVLCMARPDLLEMRPGWGDGKLNAASVAIEPLTEEQTETLIGGLLDSADVPGKIAEYIVRTAEGNPFFVEETLAMLIDDGLVLREDGRWVAIGDLSAIAMPPSIQALLAARLDRLTREERTILEAAAVVGKDFFLGAILGLVPEDARGRAPSDVMTLVRKELIRPKHSTLSGEDAFQFRHLLIRDAAYQAIPKAQRAELHERHADWLEHVAGEAMPEQEEIVAYHLEQAHAYRTQLAPSDDRSESIGGRAAARLASAGRRATGRGDFAAGVNLLSRALAVAPRSGAERAGLLFELGASFEHVGDVHASFAAFDEAVELATDAGDHPLEWLARIRRLYVQTLANPHDLSIEAIRTELEAAAREFNRLEDEGGLATAWIGLAGLEWMPCRYERGEAATRRALEHARRSGDPQLLATALTMLLAAQVHGATVPEEGFRTLDALQVDISQSRQLESSALLRRGFYHSMEGSFDEARRAMESASAITEELGLRSDVAAYDDNLGDVELLAGNSEAAERAYRRSFEILDELGDDAHKSTVAANLARALCALGRLDEAEQYAAIARNVAAEDDLASQVIGRSAQAMVLAARGEFAEAERLGREAVQMFAQAEELNYRGDVWMDHAQVLRMAGRPAEAEHSAREALALFDRKGNRPSSASTRAFIEELRNPDRDAELRP